VGRGDGVSSDYEKWDSAARQRKYKAAMTEAGFRRISLWAHVSKEDELRRVAAQLMAEFQAD